jgi:hypothetical protein
MPAPFIAARLWLAAALVTAPAAAQPGDAVTVPLGALVAAVTGWVSAETGLPLPSQPPRITYADDAEMAALRRADGGHGAAPQPSGGTRPEVIALYDTRSETILLPAGWTGGTAAELSILVHEITHHLQSEAGQRFACPGEREQAAFAAQARWLERFGSDLEREFRIDPLFLLVATTCAP